MRPILKEISRDLQRTFVLTIFVALCQLKFVCHILFFYAFMDIESAKVFKPSLVFPDEATNLLK